MNSFKEAENILKDARDCLETARRELSFHSYRIVTQNAQLAIEHFTKAVIVCFEEVRWTHNPGIQLDELISRKREEFTEKLGKDFVSRLEQLVLDAEIASPWHGLSSYGQQVNDEKISAVDICTEKIAKDLLKKAERSFATSEKFFQRITSLKQN